MADAPVIERDEVGVLFLGADDGLENIQRLWPALEAAVGSLRGRRFYGAFYPKTNRYLACVERIDADDPRRLGLEEGSLPAGRYARLRLRGERPDHEPNRPSIEFYRRVGEIDLLLPVRPVDG
jgi:hypothetical protein